MNANALRGAIAENGFKHSDVAKALGMSAKTFSQKLNKGKFGTDEADAMIPLLKLKDPASIFFDNKVT